MTTFRVYSRRGCHLCEQLLGELEALLRQRGRIEVRDVDERDEWRERFGQQVPVVCVDDRRICEFQLDRKAVLAELDNLSTRPRAL